MKTANLVVAGLFIFGAGVQVNDPDPLLWIIVYLVAAVTCIVAHYKPAFIALPAVVGVASVVWAATLAPSVISQVPFGDMFGAWEMENEGIERSREMYGLVIIAIWMGVLFFRGRRLRKG